MASVGGWRGGALDWPGMPPPFVLVGAKLLAGVAVRPSGNISASFFFFPVIRDTFDSNCPLLGENRATRFIARVFSFRKHPDLFNKSSEAQSTPNNEITPRSLEQRTIIIIVNEPVTPIVKKSLCTWP